jgi:hypothetical protein
VNPILWIKPTPFHPTESDSTAASDDAVSFTIETTITHSYGMEYVGHTLPVSKSNGTATGNVSSTTSVGVDNAGASMMARVAGVVAGVACVLVVVM